MICGSAKAAQQLSDAARLWLFLDYDGTLAEFAATPDTINPDHKLVELIRTLVQNQNYRLAIVSGRRLAHIRSLLPVKGLWLAGTYGIELLTPEGQIIHRQSYEAVRSKIDEFKPEWESLLSARSDIYLEDKGWALAIHAKDAADQLLTRFGQMNGNIASIRLIPTTLHQISFLQVVDHKGDIARAFEDLVGNLFLMHGSQMENGFQHTKLADGQIVIRQMAVNAGRD